MDIQLGIGILCGISFVAVLCANKWHMYRLKKAVHQKREEHSRERQSRHAVSVSDRSTNLGEEHGSSPECLETLPGAGILSDKLYDLLWMSFEQPVRPEDLRSIMSYLMVNTHYVELFFWDIDKKGWISIEHLHGPIERMCCGLQMASRDWCLSGQFVTDIHEMWKTCAAQHRAKCVVHPVEEVLRRVASLKSFVDASDIEVGLTVLADRSLFPGTKLRSLAEASGCRLGSDGFFHRFSVDGSQQIFHIKNIDGSSFLLDAMRVESYQGVSLFMDFPCIPDPVDAFNQMLAFSRRLSVSLGAQIVDNDYKILDDHGFETIRKYLIAGVQRMNHLNISPGSPLAMRLFQGESNTTDTKVVL